MNKFVVFLDNGHGGVVDGRYVTAGKRSPLFDDGSQLFEGVYNREIVRLIHDKLLAHNDLDIVIEHVAPGTSDTPLGSRVKTANEIWVKMNRPKAIYISIHGDAAGDGVHWHPASGISVYTSKGQTRSDVFASILIDKLEEIVPNVKWRTDETDHDEDKEENFYVLKETQMPAILSENGFMTNHSECARMLTPLWKDVIAQAHVNAIIAFKSLS